MIDTAYETGLVALAGEALACHAGCGPLAVFTDKAIGWLPGAWPLEFTEQCTRNRGWACRCGALPSRWAGGPHTAALVTQVIAEGGNIEFFIMSGKWSGWRTVRGE